MIKWRFVLRSTGIALLLGLTGVGAFGLFAVAMVHPLPVLLVCLVFVLATVGYALGLMG